MLLAAALLCACSALQTPPPKGAGLTGALLVVRLVGRLEAPAAVQVEVSSLENGGVAAVTGRRQQSVPGQYADYLVSLPLAPKRYMITALHQSREPAAEGSPPPTLLMKMAAPFEVPAKGPVYLGRIVLAADGPSAALPIEVQDHYDDDTLLFRSAIGALRDVAIASDVIATASLAPGAPGERSATSNTAGLKLLTVDSISAGADSALAPSARVAFVKFLRLKPPRAFAVGTTDARAFAFGSGIGSIDRALRDCARSANSHACRLFAVDDVSMSTLACGADAGGATRAEAPLARCPAAASGSP